MTELRRGMRSAARRCKWQQSITEKQKQRREEIKHPHCHNFMDTSVIRTVISTNYQSELQHKCQQVLYKCNSRFLQANLAMFTRARNSSTQCSLILRHVFFLSFKHSCMSHNEINVSARILSSKRILTEYIVK